MGKGRIIGAKVGGEGRGGKGGRNIFLDGLDGLIGIWKTNTDTLHAVQWVDKNSNNKM